MSCWKMNESPRKGIYFFTVCKPDFILLKHSHRNPASVSALSCRDTCLLCRALEGRAGLAGRWVTQDSVVYSQRSGTPPNWASDPPARVTLTSPPPPHAEEIIENEKATQLQKQFETSVSSFHLIIEKFGFIELSLLSTHNGSNFKLKDFQYITNLRGRNSI